MCNFCLVEEALEGETEKNSIQYNPRCATSDDKVGQEISEHTSTVPFKIMPDQARGLPKEILLPYIRPTSRQAVLASMVDIIERAETYATDWFDTVLTLASKRAA